MPAGNQLSMDSGLTLTSCSCQLHLWSQCDDYSINFKRDESTGKKMAGHVTLTVIIDKSHFERITKINYIVGKWLSLVEHSVRDAGVGGSNPLFPTNKYQGVTVGIVTVPLSCYLHLRGTNLLNSPPFRHQQPSSAKLSHNFGQ